MKNMKARTKLYEKFARVPIKILDEQAAIMINGKLVALGNKAKMNGLDCRVAFSSDAQLKYFLDMQNRMERLPEYYGRMKDGVYFIFGFHRWTQRNSLVTRKQQARFVESKERFMETLDNAFTGKQRSGDLRRRSARIAIKKKV